MPWNFQVSPLDDTIDALDRLAAQMRRELNRGDELTVEDFRAVMIFVERIAEMLRPLQDLKIEEQR
jgi:hypothetical protein